MSSTLKVSNGDLYIDEVTGQPSLIDGVEKCSQDVAEVLMTDLLQKNRSGLTFRRSYGSELASLNTPTFFSGNFGKPLVGRKIQEAIQTLIEMQGLDSNVTDDERIDRIGRLAVEAIDASSYIYFVEVIVKSESPVPSVSNLEAVKLDHQFALPSAMVGSGSIPNT